SDFIEKPHFKLFLRYDARDNQLIKKHCEDFIPMKEDGLNWRFKTRLEGGNLHIGNQNFADEDFGKALLCMSSIYQVSINDSLYQDLNFRFFTHPDKDQKGIITVIPTDHFLQGENILDIKRIELDSIGSPLAEDFATIPFWFRSQ
ncbi:MAG: hypothetical protein ABJQ38_01290, partial [Flavobacteriaceae bacterium]